MVRHQSEGEHMHKEGDGRLTARPNDATNTSEPEEASCLWASIMLSFPFPALEVGAGL